MQVGDSVYFSTDDLGYTGSQLVESKNDIRYGDWQGEVVEIRNDLALVDVVMYANPIETYDGLRDIRAKFALKIIDFEKCLDPEQIAGFTDEVNEGHDLWVVSRDWYKRTLFAA